VKSEPHGIITLHELIRIGIRLRGRESVMRKITTKWLKQAEADLNAAKDSLAGRHYEWSCF